MTKVDRDALKRAMAITAAESEGRAEQLTSMLKDDSWERVAMFAASCAQSRALRLKPWELPPMHADEGPLRPEDRAARKLLKKMLVAGISRYEPDPMAALDRATRR